MHHSQVRSNINGTFDKTIIGGEEEVSGGSAALNKKQTPQGPSRSSPSGGKQVLGVEEVSEAQGNDTSDIQSPLILTRSFQTTLSIDDGETVLIAGLISENFSNGENGIPYLKDIPLLGNLFKNSSQSVQKTELIVLLTPYIIDSRDTSRSVRDAFRSQLTGLSTSFDDIE